MCICSAYLDVLWCTFSRSKSSVVCSPGVKVIEESPQRSFYSSAVRPDSADGFRTPPSVSNSRQQVFVKKDPSPAGLHSLLHGEIISPHVTPEGRHSYACSTPPLATVTEDEGSPELLSSGGSVSESESGDRVRQRRGNAVARSLNYGNEEEEEDIFLSTPVRVVSDPLLTPQKSILKTPGEHTTEDFDLEKVHHNTSR